MADKQNIESSNHNLPINEYIELHKKGWKVQKIGWAFIFLIMLLGLLGMYGEGYISEQKLSAADISVGFDRFYRYEKEMKILITSQGVGIQTISVPQRYLKHFKVTGVSPQPQFNEMIGDDIVYHFSGSGNKVVSVYAVPEVYGNISGSISVNQKTFSIHHFIFP